MTTRIYIWKPTLGVAELSAFLCQDVGHVSMSIDDLEYLSHRPPSNDLSLELQKIEYISQKNNNNRDLSKKYIIKDFVLPCEPSDNFNYQKDVERFRKREADIMYEICGLNEYKMSKHWHSSKYLYHPLFCNCSGVIVKTFLASFCTYEKLKTEEEILSLIKDKSGGSISRNLITIFNVFRSNFPSIVKFIFCLPLGIWVSYKIVYEIAENIIFLNKEENVLWTPNSIPHLLDTLEHEKFLQSKGITIRRCT